MRRADRLFQILLLLRRGRVVTARALAEELEVAERTVYRDLRDLMQSGVPVRGEAGVGYRLERGYELPPLLFPAEELAALALGAQVVQSWGDPALARAARSALERIDAVLPEPLRKDLREPALLAPGHHVPAAATAALGALRDAIRARRKVRFAYEDRGGAPSRRTVRPLGVFFWGSAWSLGAYCELRADFRNFRLDRVRDLEVLDELFEDEPGLTLWDLVQHYRGS